MGVSIERLRIWLLAGAGLLLLVIAGFVGYARIEAHRFLKDLPGRLGADITRESNGFTYSQSLKGRTVYTIHASKMVQRKDGKTTLEDVGIVLYGQRGDRADRIYGSEFEYDQKAGVVRAMGVVHLDLQAPAPTDARSRAEYAAGRDPVGAGGAPGESHAEDNDRLVHVKTSGLVFMQKLGVASTDQEIEFQYHGMNGRARGANYSSDTGVTVLQSEVRISGLRNGQPQMLTATHAEMDKNTAELRLTHTRYVAVGDVGGAGKEDNRALTAEQAVVHLRADGSVERVLANGGVTVGQAGGTLRGQTAEVAVSAENRPETAHLWGGLTYAAEDPLRQMEGHAGQGTARWDGAGRVESAVLTEAAEVHVRERATPGAGEWNERTVAGERIDLKFATAAGNRQWMRDGTATGGARMLLVDRAARPAKVEETTELRGESLTAQMSWDGRVARLSHVSGTGHTVLRRRDGAGGEDTSEGQGLDVTFAPSASGGSGRGASLAGGAMMGGGTTVARAVQGGGVTLTHVAARAEGPAVGLAGGPAAGPAVTKGPAVIKGTARQASFEGDGQTLTLSGQAQVTEEDSLLRAETVTMRRGSGDATAEGSVQVSYRQAGAAQPVHVVAARADMRRDRRRAVFYGERGVPARMWQGGSQVEAPVIEFSQTEKTLTASTTGAGGEEVRTVLVSGNGRSGVGGGRERGQVMRVTSRSLRYSDRDRRAQFEGGVVLQGADGTMRGAQMTALLKTATPAAGGAAETAGATQAGFMGGSVERVTAEGGVEVNEGSRRAVGERLVYTAADGRFVMTGTEAVPPRVVDEAQGTVTGAALEFHAGDNSVMIVGDGRGGEGRRVRTETQVRQR